MVLRLPSLPMTAAAKLLYDELIASGTIPATKPRDALHLAVAAAHEIDYLLTWNYAHLANPVAQVQAEAVCHEFERRAPLLVSPESIPQVRFGQPIRRRKAE